MIASMKFLHSIAVLILLAVLASGCAAATSDSSQPHFTAPIHASIDYAVDGDTLRVRLPSAISTTFT